MAWWDFIAKCVQNPRTIIIIIINNYSPKWRWLVVDIYRAAKRRGKYQPLATDTEVYSCNKHHQQLIWMISSLVTDANRTPFSLELLGGK